MSLKVKNKSKPALPPVNGGTYQARCVGIVDLGEQHNSLFNKYEDKVLFIWELPSVTVEVDGEMKPRWLSRDFSMTISEKSNLAKFLVPWRGKNFTDEELNGEGYDLRERLGEACFLQVIVEDKDGKQFNRITSCMGYPEGVPLPVSDTELLWFDIDEWNDEVFQKLPEWVQDRVKRSTQYKKLHAPATTVEVKDQSPATEGACPI